MLSIVTNYLFQNSDLKQQIFISLFLRVRNLSTDLLSASDLRSLSRFGQAATEALVSSEDTNQGWSPSKLSGLGLCSCGLLDWRLPSIPCQQVSGGFPQFFVTWIFPQGCLMTWPLASPRVNILRERTHACTQDSHYYLFTNLGSDSPTLLLCSWVEVSN